MLTQLVASQIKTNAVGNMVASQFLALGRNLYARGLDQTDEYDADRTGVALATRAGFDPYGLVSVLQQLRTATPDNPAFTLALHFTHPPHRRAWSSWSLPWARTLGWFHRHGPRDGSPAHEPCRCTRRRSGAITRSTCRGTCPQGSPQKENVVRQARLPLSRTREGCGMGAIRACAPCG